MALGSRRLLIVWPVKTLVVEVPADSVSVTRVCREGVQTCVVVGVDVVTDGDPSPKSHA